MMFDSQIATETTDKSLTTRPLAMVAFIVHQVLLFWPPYRVGPEDAGPAAAEPGKEPPAGGDS